MDRHSLIRGFESAQLKENVADIRVGETVRVHYKIREGNKERVQIFEGLVVATKGGLTIQGSFTVRKVVSGIGVERTFPLHSPHIVKIERIKSGKVRQAKLNFVREHAMSSRFKLRDKGVAGTVWETIAEQQEEIEHAKAGQEASVESEIAETAATPVDQELAKETVAEDNATDELRGQDTGTYGRDAGGEPAESQEVPDSGAE
jgi:large subunit ribosomal protein L19